jgi:hypothetical protein
VEFEIEFVEGDSPADIEIALSGAPSPSSFVKLNEHLVGDARFRAGMKILADLSELDVSDLPPDASATGTSNRQVFRSRPEALAWLQAQKAG